MSPPTLASTLAPLRSKLVPALCSGAELDAIEALARALPPVPAAGFERELGPELGRRASGLDLAICVRPGQPATRALRDAGPVGGGEPLRALLSAAEDPASPLRGRLDRIWLEYDVSRGGARPSLFVGPLGDARHELAARVSEVVLGAPLAAPVARALERLAAPLAGVELFQVGWMLGRERAGLRLCACASTSRLAGFDALLDRLDGVPARERLRALSRRYAAHVTQLALAVDIGEGAVGPRVGLELGYGGAQHGVLLQRWDGLLGALVEDELCTPEQQRALIRWPARVRQGGLLRSHARHVDHLLHHVKLVVEDREVRGAKVYFGVQQGWAKT